MFIFFIFFSLSLSFTIGRAASPHECIHSASPHALIAYAPSEARIGLSYHPPFYTLIMSNQSPRPLYQIAREIAFDWPKPYFGAKPYLEAMYSLNSVSDKYLYDSAESIVRYFLSNATTWKGESARRIKAELNSMLKSHAN